MQPIDRFGRAFGGRVKTKGVVGRRDVVVDRLRYRDHVHAALGEFGAGPQRSVAAHSDQAIEFEDANGFKRLGRARLGPERARSVFCAEDRAALGQDSAD